MELTLRGQLIPPEQFTEMLTNQLTMTEADLKITNYLTALWLTPRLEEIIIITLLTISIGIGIAVLINQRKIKKQLRQLLDQKEDKDVS